MEAALDLEAEDVTESGDTVEVITTPAEFSAVNDGLAERDFRPINAEISMVPSTTVDLSGPDAEKMLRMLDALEDLDDVQHVYSNFEISDEEMAKFA
jgi:transcriptional/translational regulatory protein YebC/TACO1